MIHAAADSDGLIACQWAKALGARVIGTVSNEAIAELAKKTRLRPHHLLHARRNKLHQLSDKRVTIGAEGSGIRDFAMQLLSANEIKSDSKNILSISGVNAAQALQQGEIGAVFTVAAQKAPVVQTLLHAPKSG